MTTRSFPGFVIWAVSLVVAGVIGFWLRQPEKVREPATQRTSIPVQRETAAPAAVPKAKANPLFPQREWPDGVPAGGPALRDFVANLLRNDDPVERTFAYLSLLRCADKDNIKFLYDGWDALRKEGIYRPEVEQPMNYRSGEVNGAVALAHRKGSAYDLSVAGYVAVTLDGWNHADPAAARTWVESLPDGKFRERMIESMVAFMAISDPGGAQRLLSSLPPDMQGSAASQMAARIRAKNGMGGALDWLAQVPPGEDGTVPAWAESASAQLIQDGIRVKQSAAGVARALEQRLANPVVTSERLVGLARSYVLADPEQAFAWAVRVEAQGNSKAPSGQLLAAMVEAAYADKVPAMEQWLMDNPDIPGRDHAVAKLCTRLAATDPVKAAQWAARITDPALRQSVTPQ